MATDRRRLTRALAALPAALALPAMLLLATPVTTQAAAPWWEPLAFAGQRVTSVTAEPLRLIVTTATGAHISADGGRSFQVLDPNNPLSPRVQPDATFWEIHSGTVFTGQPGHGLIIDARAPFLGDSAHLIAAPAALPGVVVAVGSDNHVWRRDASGQWATSFILLPAGGLSGIPQVTSVAAFTLLSRAVYMGTAGYGVLISEDGGDDWIRADPGLPENVLALAADTSARALYAATDQGLFVHHLQALPAPPVYHDASLYLRWLGIALVALLATVAAIVGIRRALPAASVIEG
jgi:hypothetical protein